MNDPGYSFSEVMAHIDLQKHFMERKGRKNRTICLCTVMDIALLYIRGKSWHPLPGLNLAMADK